MVDVGALRSSADLAQGRRRRNMSIFVVALSAMCWFAWFTSIHHHWAGISNHFVAVAFLALLPCPCISVFAKSFFKSQGFTPVAALYTYVLLLLANSMPPAFF
jgi:hypothetical protein